MLILQSCFYFINYFLLLTKLTCFCDNQKMTPWVKCDKNIKFHINLEDKKARKLSPKENKVQYLCKFSMSVSQGRKRHK